MADKEWIDHMQSAFADILSGEREPGTTHAFNLQKQLERLFLTSVSEHEYLAEINRASGQSGIIASRQYDQDYASHVGFAPINAHSHPDFRRMVGQAEMSAMINGTYLRTRHNDYPLRRPATSDKSFLATDLVEPPALPSDVVGTPEQQITAVKKYLKALSGELDQDEVADFAGAFQWVMSYLECWWELVDEETLTDAFESARHKIDAGTIRELIAKDQYYAHSGHKNRKENIPSFVYAIKSVDERGRPVFAIFKYRICAARVGSLVDFPVKDILDRVDDPLVQLRWPNYDIEKTRSQRYRVRQEEGAEYRRFDWNKPTLLDEFMSHVPGLNGYGAKMTETHKYPGEVEDLLYHYDKPEVLESAYYSRFYSMKNRGAANRSKARRGYNDPMLWVARTNRKEVLAHTDAGESFAYSYAIPLELVIDTFLDRWDPYEVQRLEDLEPDAEGQKQRLATLLQGVRSGAIGKEEMKPVDAQHDDGLYYHTPIELFTSSDETGDPADTGAHALWMMCKDGKARKHYASGIPFFLPKVDGKGKPVRLRYPIYPVHYEGSDMYQHIQGEVGRINAQLEHLRASLPIAPNFIVDSKKFTKLCGGEVNKPMEYRAAHGTHVPWAAPGWPGTKGTGTIEVVTLDKLQEKGIKHGGDLERACRFSGDEVVARDVNLGDFYVLFLDIKVEEDPDAVKPKDTKRVFVLCQGNPPLTGWGTGEVRIQSRVMVNVLEQTGETRFHVMSNRTPSIVVGKEHVGEGWQYHTASKVGLGGNHQAMFEGLGSMKVAICLPYSSFGDHGEGRFVWAGSVGHYFSDDV